MLWRKMVLVAIVFFSIAVPCADAQHSFEVTPFFGGRFGGVIEESSAISPTVSYDHILIKSSLDYGALVDYALPSNFKAEFMFNRQPTIFSGHFAGGTTSVKLTDATLDEYEWGFQYAFRSPQAKLKPYLVFGMGFTHFYPSDLAGFTNRFSDSFGGGMKYFFADHFGMRLEARWSPTATTTGEGLFCGRFGCYQATAPYTAQQGQVNLGFIFRFK